MQTEKRPSRGYQFSLRALMLLMLITGSFLGGWVANEMRHRNAQEEEVAIQVINAGTANEVFVMRGRKPDVNRVKNILVEIDESESAINARNDTTVPGNVPFE